MTVNYTTRDGSACGGDDYAATSGQLRFEPGVSTQVLACPEQYLHQSSLGDTNVHCSALAALRLLTCITLSADCPQELSACAVCDT